jgi:hypothetical protein
MLERKISVADVVAVAVAVLITWFVDYATALPRMILLALVFPQYSDPAPKLATAFFLVETFGFGIATGVLAMAASRKYVRKSSPGPVAVFSGVLVLAYSVVTIPLFGFMGSIVPIFVDRLPAFLPVYLEICGALPGWILGYYFGCGMGAQREIGGRTMLIFGVATSLVVAAVFIAPVHVPADLPLVPEEFHKVPEPPVRSGYEVRVLPPSQGQ